MNHFFVKELFNLNNSFTVKCLFDLQEVGNHESSKMSENSSLLTIKKSKCYFSLYSILKREKKSDYLKEEVVKQ